MAPIHRQLPWPPDYLAASRAVRRGPAAAPAKGPRSPPTAATGRTPWQSPRLRRKRRSPGRFAGVISAPATSPWGPRGRGRPPQFLPSATRVVRIRIDLVEAGRIYERRAGLTGRLRDQLGSLGVDEGPATDGEVGSSVASTRSGPRTGE